ncbi:MAG: hypothetical protein POELPBGB_00086 [Bacteroidia bacterium]|nr:hypothetical protein [Bacteroidia bacterium]
MSFFSFVFSKNFLKHLGIALGVFIVLILLIIFSLNAYTGHGETIAVPNLSGINKTKLDSALANLELKHAIIDSVYLNNKPKGSVVDQTPAPGFHVKAGRTVYVTVVAMQPQRVKMPNLVDLTLRQATQRLETYGLKVGKTSYQPDIAKNVVLKQLWKGRKIYPDSLVVKGSSIELVLGDGLNDSEIPMPYYINLTPEQAEEAIKSGALIKGAFIFDAEVKDSLKSRVYKQRPAYTQNSVIKIGDPVDLWFTENEEKIEYDPSLHTNPIDDGGEMMEGSNENYDE